MKTTKRLLAWALAVVLVFGCAASGLPTPAAAAEAWQRGLNGAMGWNESTYYTIAKKTTNNNWREALASANGEIAIMESGDPDEDVFIFNNTKIVYDDNGVHEVPYLADIIDTQRAGVINYNNWVWNQAANRYDEQTYGISGGRGMVWSRPYQPAGQYRIKNNDYTAANKTNYNRYTNYETAEVGAQWKDSAGNEWNRRSFASRADDVIVTYIEAPAGKTLNLTVSMDHLTDMRNEGTVDAMPESDYVVTEEGGSVVGFGTVAKYAIRNERGTKNQNKTLFSYGGWATATRIVLGDGGKVAYNAATRTVSSDRGFSINAAFQANDPKLTITGTGSVMLITKVDRQDDGCQNVADVKAKLYDRLQGEIAQLVSSKSVRSTEAGYQTLLAPHAAIHGGMFNNVRIDLCQTDAEKADRALTNQQLIQKQNSNKTSVNKAFLERVYNNGRYGLICAHGYGSTRLGAIWCGTWNPSWSGDYTLDANTNLQISGLNTGNMMEAGQGYINFIVRMVADWAVNAEKIYGMTDAILAPPRVDGTGQGQSYHYGDVYPHVFVNGITDWLLLPIFEYWQCYGNQKIELGKDIDPARNADVLDWSKEDIARIKRDGYYDLEEDVLFPMAMKAMNFWMQLADERYYTDGSGNRHVNDGTTLSQAVAGGDQNAKYIFAPGFSPENTPEKGGANVQALAYNVTMDIAAARDSLFIARTLLEKKNPNDPRLVQWDAFESRIPDYLYETKTGELKEWASESLREAHNHRHESHAYAAWPGYDAQDDEAIREGLAIAMDMRAAAYGGEEATESHGATHKALVEARLKRPVALERVMLYLLTNGYQYSNMLTSHNRNKSSCLCTDSAFGLMGAVNESLLYSNTDVIEILPTLLPNLDKGSITGLRARCNTQADIYWDTGAHTASVTLTTDETSTAVRLMCGLDWQKATVGGKVQSVKHDELGRAYIELTLKKGESTKVEFSLTQEDTAKTRNPYGVLAANACDSAKAGVDTSKADGSIGETRSLDYIAFKNMDFGTEGSTAKVVLHVANSRTTGGLNRDGSSVIKLYTADPNSGAAALAQVTVANTGGRYKKVEVKLPARLMGVQDLYIKFQDGGCTLKSVEFTEMAIANVVDGAKYDISACHPLTLELNTESYRFTLGGKSVTNGYQITQEGNWSLVVTKIDGGTTQTINFQTYTSAANRVLEKSVVVKPGERVQLAGRVNDPAVKLWLAPVGTTRFVQSDYMTMAPSENDWITAPIAEGSYVLYAVNGEVFSQSYATVRVRTANSYIDFTDPSYAGAFEIVNQSASIIREGEGLYMVTTKDGFEPANGQLEGAAATTPKDLVLVEVDGDWEATLEFSFDKSGASNGYYQFFGFYAMQDYDNCAGIRGGDGAMQDFLRVGGNVTAETQNSEPGLAADGTYWYRITKEADSYTCYRSSDGEGFIEIFRFANTGIEATKIAIDAYTGMTEGYAFLLKNLDMGGEKSCTHVWGEWEVTTAPTAIADGEETRTCAICGEEETQTVPMLGFEDVPATRYYYEAVMWAAKAGITTGVDETHFAPNNECTRAQAVMFLWNAAGCPEVAENVTNPFTDVKADRYYYKAVLWAISNNITDGTDDTHFSPNKKLDRGTFVTFLWRAKGEEKVDATDRFTDVSAGRFYAKAVAWAVANGITDGITDTTFAPGKQCTRAQVVTFLQRAYDK